jgi:formylglycine-generating enzyme required for sulfatase activity
MPNIFISYSHDDTEWLTTILDFLKVMLRHLGEPYAHYRVWYDRHIGAGATWTRELQQAMDESEVAILLLSISSLASDFIMNQEVPYLLELRKSKGIELIPLIVRPCPWAEDEVLSEIQARPWEGEPLSTMTKDQANTFLIAFIKEIAQKLKADRRLPAECPYKGLFAFQEADSEIFFGREAVALQLVALLAKTGVLPIVGASGSGKSSLVKAGIIPRLRAEHWSIIAFKPYRWPLGELAKAIVRWFEQSAAAPAIDKVDEAELEGRLRRDAGHFLERLKAVSAANRLNKNILIFVDQWEEIFTLCSDTERGKFLDVLLHFTRAGDAWSREHLHLILTLRYDFLEPAMRQEGLGPVLQAAGLQPLMELVDCDLRDAIERPALGRGATFERGLIDLIVRQVGNERGKLPLLEFCLQQLWDKQRELGGAVLTRAAYQAIKEFKGAVTDYAERIYDGLDPDEKAAAREVFKHLVNVSTGDDQRGDTRRPATSEELYGIKKIGDPELVRRVLDRLVASRLLVADRGNSYEVSHEILIRAWDRLKAWVDEDREFFKKRKIVEQHRVLNDPLYGNLLNDCEVWLEGRREELEDREIRFIEQSLAAEAEKQVEKLLEARVENLFGVCKSFQHRGTLNRVLRRRLEAGPAEEVRRRLSLALLPADDGQVEYLGQQLLKIEPDEFFVIRQALEPFKDGLIGPLWKVSLDPKAPQMDQIRATGALALYDPESPNWATIVPRIASRLVGENPLIVGPWAKTLYPVCRILIGPLEAIFSDLDWPEAERGMAASLLVDYARDQPELLAKLAVRAEPKQFIALLPAIELDPARSIAGLERELTAGPAPGDNPDSEARRSALVALKLARLGLVDHVWPLLQFSPDPGRRSHLIHLIESLRIDPPQLLLDRLAIEPDVSARRALILALGEYPRDRLLADQQRALVEQLLRLYRDDPDPGLHSAAAWLLRRWGYDEELRAILADLAGKDPAPGRGWSVNAERQTFVRVRGPVEFLMGSPADEPDRDHDEPRHRRRISRSFALATEPVTNRQFRCFLDAHPEIKTLTNERFSRGPDCPVILVTWYTAAQYCRWLSEREGLAEDQMCYPPVEEVEKVKQSNLTTEEHTDLLIAAGYLHRTGYRLPAEAEWEYAARSGSEAARPYGAGDELLRHYGWYMANSRDTTHPVGQLKPNDLGLFDILGNVWEWCHDPWERTYEAAQESTALEDHEFLKLVASNKLRILRGGSFAHSALFLRSARRWAREPGYEYDFVGFRVARTLP